MNFSGGEAVKEDDLLVEDLEKLDLCFLYVL